MPLTSPRVRAKSTPRSQPPTLSPALRIAALSVANGGGLAAVGFLRGRLQDAPAQNACWENAQSCLERCENAWASCDDKDLVEMAPPHYFDTKDIVPPASPASGSGRPNRLKKKKLSFLVEENERCSCCAKEEFWVVYDVFVLMDRQGEGCVRRGDFVWSLGAHGASVDFQRVVRRSRLSAYFKATARDIPLEEFMLRYFPNANDTDIMKMHRWVNLRRAYSLVKQHEFQGSHEEMKQVFSFLEEDCCGNVSACELIRAQILSRTEVLAIQLPSCVLHKMSFEVFEDSIAPKLAGYCKESEGAEGSILNGLKDALHGVQQEFGSPFTKVNDFDVEHPSLPHAHSAEVVTQSLPEGTVAALISRLNPKGQRGRADLGSGPLCGIEHSPLVSAY